MVNTAQQFRTQHLHLIKLSNNSMWSFIIIQWLQIGMKSYIQDKENKLISTNMNWYNFHFMKYTSVLKSKYCPNLMHAHKYRQSVSRIQISLKLPWGSELNEKIQYCLHCWFNSRMIIIKSSSCGCLFDYVVIYCITRTYAISWYIHHYGDYLQIITNYLSFCWYMGFIALPMGEQVISLMHHDAVGSGIWPQTTVTSEIIFNRSQT